MSFPFQVQGWPTPEIFIRRSGGRLLREFSVAGLALMSLTMPTPVTRTLAADSGVAGLALVSCTLPGFSFNTVSDIAVAGLALQSVILPTPITRTIGPDQAVAGLTLKFNS